MDDESHFLVIRLGPKTSECEKNVNVVTTVTSCDVTNCATTFSGSTRNLSDCLCLMQCQVLTYHGSSPLIVK